jgi:hypothetical protein
MGEIVQKNYEGAREIFFLSPSFLKKGAEMEKLFRFNRWLIKAVRIVWRWYCQFLVKNVWKNILEVFRDNGTGTGCIYLLIWFALVIIGFPVVLLASFILLPITWIEWLCWKIVEVCERIIWLKVPARRYQKLVSFTEKL